MDELLISDDNICSLIQKKCHPKSYQSDIKYHVALNIIFSVVLSSLKVKIRIVIEMSKKSIGNYMQAYPK